MFVFYAQDRNGSWLVLDVIDFVTDSGEMLSDKLAQREPSGRVRNVWIVPGTYEEEM